MEVAGSAAAQLKRAHLELGGKAPVIVFDDADVEAAAEGIAMAGYFNGAGQDCTAATPVLAGGVHQDFGGRAHRAGQGHPHRRTGRRGRALRRAQQREPAGPGQRDDGRLPDHATVRTEGLRQGERGYFYDTVVSGLQQDDEAIQEEIFGPVITVQKFGDEAEALRWASGVKAGLASSVWTKDHGRAMRMAKQLTDFGAVWINTSRSSPRCRTAASALRLRQGPVHVRGWRTTRASST